MLGVNNATGGLYNCTSGGAWNLIGGGGGGTAFSALSGGTNTTAAMIVGTGASLSSVPQFNIGAAGTSGVLGLLGTTSGTATFTAPAIAGTSTNGITVSNNMLAPDGTNTSPAWAFTSQTGTGIYTNGGNLNISRQGTNVAGFSNTALNSISAYVYSWNSDTGLSRGAAGLVEVGNGTAADTTGLVLSGNKALLTSDFTDSNASGLQVITGMSFALPNVTKNWSFHCSFTYSEATPIANDQFGVASLTTAPTNLHAWAHVITTEGVTAVQQTADSGNITSTTPTSIITFTPNGTGIKQADIDGSIEVAGSGASTLQFYVTNGTAADVIVIKRGSYCRID